MEKTALEPLPHLLLYHAAQPDNREAGLFWCILLYSDVDGFSSSRDSFLKASQSVRSLRNGQQLACPPHSNPLWKTLLSSVRCSVSQEANQRFLFLIAGPDKWSSRTWIQRFGEVETNWVNPSSLPTLQGQAPSKFSLAVQLKKDDGRYLLGCQSCNRSWHNERRVCVCVGGGVRGWSWRLSSAVICQGFSTASEITVDTHTSVS